MKKSDANKYDSFRPIGLNQSVVKIPTEGMDAHGRETQLIKHEIPNRIDEINDELIYLGWAEYGSSESEYVWKIKKIYKSATVWKQEYANGNQFFTNRWDDRSVLSYS